MYETADSFPPDGDPSAMHPIAHSGTVGLRARDIEILRLIADGDGECVSAIARTLCYSESTVKKAILFIRAQLGAANQTHAVAIAVRTQII